MVKTNGEMMKTLLVILLFFSVTGYSQEMRRLYIDTSGFKIEDQPALVEVGRCSFSFGNYDVKDYHSPCTIEIKGDTMKFIYFLYDKMTQNGVDKEKVEADLYKTRTALLEAYEMIVDLQKGLHIAVNGLTDIHNTISPKKQTYENKINYHHGDSVRP
jgi:hypothetical protein